MAHERASGPVHDLDALTAAREWIAVHGSVMMATVVETWGSSPVPAGGQLAVLSDDIFQGSVSGGCVEADVIGRAPDILRTGAPAILDFGVADEAAWRAGLPCGGRIRVYCERLERETGLAFVERLLDARRRRAPIVARTRLADGARDMFDLAGGAPKDVAEAFQTGESRLAASPDGDVFLHCLAPATRILVIGATHIAQVLIELGRLAGYEALVVDPRTAYASSARFPAAALVTEWPRDALPRIGFDRATALVALAHAAHIDDEALALALRSGCFYIGALGSARSHAKRAARLADAGFTPDDLARIHAPVGLDIGARTPPEIALSIMAEIVLAARGRKRP